MGGGAGGAELTDFLTIYVNIQSAINSGEDIDEAMRALRNEEHFAALDSVLRGTTRGNGLSGVTPSIDGTAIPSRGLQDIGEFLLGVPARPVCVTGHHGV